jgi:predicted nuclease of predicted toxin-antitoxin system
VKLLLDMNISPAWAPILSEQGHDVVHWSTVGAPDAPDTAIMARAELESRVVITHDLDLTTILAVTNARGPSVIQLRQQNILPDAASTVLVRVLRDFAEQLSAGAVVTVEEDRSRVRVLPLSR